MSYNNDMDIGLVLGFVAFLFIVAILLVTFSGGNADQNKTEAQKIHDFKNNEQSCEELEKQYLRYEPIKYKDSKYFKWYQVIRDKLLDGCMTQIDLNNFEYIAMCYNSNSVGCELSKLEHPELYESFENRTKQQYQGRR